MIPRTLNWKVTLCFGVLTPMWEDSDILQVTILFNKAVCLPKTQGIPAMIT